MKKTILLFDFDGTIADTFSHGLRIYNRLAGEFGLRVLEEREALELRNKTFAEFVRYARIPALLLPLLIIKARHEMRQEIATALPAEGVKEVIQRLKEQGYRMSILTSNASENVARFLGKHGMEWFETIRSVRGIWGKTRALRDLLAEMNLPPDRFLFVGDSMIDIRSVHKAGLRIAAVTWGFNSRQVLELHHPDYLAQRPEDLLAICERMD